MSTGLGELLKDERVAHLDLSRYLSVEERTPVGEVVQRMRQARCATALVTRGETLAGIFTSRDVLHRVLDRPETWQQPVSRLMSAPPVVTPPDRSVLDVVRQMNAGHFRNLPVVDGAGRLVGNLTDEAVIRHLGDRLQAEVLNLPPDPSQVPRTVEGA